MAAPDAAIDQIAAPPTPTAALTLAALGVVYGDIGTSPLYTIREAFGEAGGLALSELAVLGVLSLVFWSLSLIVSLKYVALILRADNRGEGGVLALGTLAAQPAARRTSLQKVILALSLAGLALFYGDGLITPAISVLSAVEGLETAAPALKAHVVPLAVVILFLLFVLQSRGTASVGKLFGPVMLVWFATLAILGLIQIVQHPWVLRALDPRYAIGLFELAGWQAFVALGAVVLAVTGAEALYADMGHFGRAPIQRAWFGLVLPALVLNYFGQGALILHEPAALAHPFYHLVADWALFPLIGLATLATIIASQAVISGVFSLTHQAVQLGHLSRMTIRHTSTEAHGQIYIPRVNWLLMIGVLALVVGFGSSGRLAAAYGISVTGAMAIDAILAGIVAAAVWRWGWLAFLVFGGFFLLDFTYLAANALKIPSGGWLPLAIAAAFAFTVITWRRGRRIVRAKSYGHGLTLRSFVDHLDQTITRVPGSGVYLTADAEIVPVALLHNLKHNHVLHQKVVLLTVVTLDIPWAPAGGRVDVEPLGRGFHRVIVSYGFADEPDVPLALAHCHAYGVAIDPALTSFFISRETLIPSDKPELNWVEERLFMLLQASNLSATTYFQIPPGQVVELGVQIEV